VSFFSTLLLALGLAADATAVSATLGLGLARVQLRHIVAVMAWFGVFQGGMALLGSLLGQAFGAYLAAWDHWIAFVLLSGLGGKMLWEARSAQQEQVPRARSFGFAAMLLLAVATSIDAFAVGVTLPLLHGDVGQACLAIGVVTALMSALGLFAGRRFGERLGRGADAVGGALLILIGLKILLEHLGLT
jgi:putative Mn2+ efflux pump MntP